jgi:hypothetical protein
MFYLWGATPPPGKWGPTTCRLHTGCVCLLECSTQGHHDLWADWWLSPCCNLKTDTSSLTSHPPFLPLSFVLPSFLPFTPHLFGEVDLYSQMVYPPKTSEYYLIWNKDLSDIIKLEIIDVLILNLGWSINTMMCSYKRKERENWDSEAQRKIHVKKKLEIWVMSLQAKGCQQPPDTKRGIEMDSPSEPPEKTSPVNHLISDYWPPECESKFLLF